MAQWWCHWCCLKCWSVGTIVYSCSISYFNISILTCPRGFYYKFATQAFNKIVKCALHQSATLTLFTQETLPAIGAEAHGLQWGLRDARCSMTAGVALASAELAQLARVEWAALAKPALRIAKIGETEGGFISPEVKSGQWICSNISRQPPEGTERDMMTQQPTLECLKALKKDAQRECG